MLVFGGVICLSSEGEPGLLKWDGQCRRSSDVFAAVIQQHHHREEGGRMVDDTLAQVGSWLDISLLFGKY